MKLFKSWMFIAAAAMTLTGCSKDNAEDPEVEPEQVTITVTAGEDDTRTSIDGANHITWDAAGESLQVFESVDGAKPATRQTETDYTLTGNKAQFSVNFTAATTGTSFVYGAIHPKESYNSVGTGLSDVRAIAPQLQAPQLASYDPAADVMVTRPITVQGARATTLNFQFGRIIALGKMTIKNLDLQAAELVKTVSITAPTKVLAGRAKVDLTQGTVLEWGYAGSTTFDNIVMQYDPAQTITAKNFDAWFTCIPFALAASDKLSIVVETNKGTYTREITMTKELKFTQGNLSTFGVDMAAAIYVPTPVDSSIFTLPFGIAVKNTTYTTNYDMAATGGSAAALAYTFSATKEQIRGNSNQFKESDYVGASSKAFWWAAAKSSLTISNITLGEGVNYALSFGAKQAATTLRVEISKDGTNFFPLAANDEPIAAAAALHTLNFHFAAAQTAAVSIRLTAGTASAVVDDVKLVALDAQGAASYLVDFMVAPALTSTPADGEALSFAANSGVAGAAPAAQSIAYTWGGGACTFAAAKAASDTWYTISDNGAGTITVTPTEYTATDKGRTGAITLTVTKAGVTAKSAVITVNQNKVGAVVKSFQLVTDVTTLAAGDKVLIVSPTASKVASTTAGAAAAFLGQVDVSIVSNAIPNVPAEATVFTVGKVGGQYTFAENTNYLNCSAKTNVSMGAFDAKSNWTLTIATDGVATMEANIAAYGFLKYNSGFPRFSTYTSGQTAIALFKEQ